MPHLVQGSLVRRFLTALALAIVLVVPAVADPAYPPFTAPVVDAAGVLSSQDEAAITQTLLDLQAKSGIQFAVATVPSLGGEEIEPYANALFRRWKLGQKVVNNGLLLLVAPKERRLRFEVGYGLEGVMTDLQAKLIIANAMVPKLKAGDAAGAIKAGVDDAITVLTTDKANWPARLKPATDAEDTSDLVVGLIVIFIIVVAIILTLRRRRGGPGWGPWATGAGIGAASDSFADSNSSSGGDGFSGGGGGDSGGGGASGSW